MQSTYVFIRHQMMNLLTGFPDRAQLNSDIIFGNYIVETGKTYSTDTFNRQ